MRPYAVWRDLDHACETIARISRKDANTYRKMVAEYKAYTASMREAAEGKSWKCAQNPHGWTLEAPLSPCQDTSTCDLFESDHVRRASLMCRRTWVRCRQTDSDTGGQTLFTSATFHLAGRVIPKGGSGTLTVALIPLHPKRMEESILCRNPYPMLASHRRRALRWGSLR